MTPETKNALLSLGCTKEEVAQSIRSLGLKGRRNSSTYDVVGKYLLSRGILGFNNWFYNDWSKTIGKAVYDFICDYDLNLYPDLVE